MQIRVEITFGLTTDRLRERSIQECEGALLDLKRGPKFVINTTKTEVRLYNAEDDMGYALESFVRTLCGIPVQLMGLTKLRAIIQRAILATAEPNPEAMIVSSFYHGTFSIPYPHYDEKTRTHYPMVTDIITVPWNEEVFVTHSCFPCGCPEETEGHVSAFLHAMSQVKQNIALTRAAKLLIEAQRSDNEGMVGRYGKKMYQLISELIPK